MRWNPPPRRLIWTLVIIATTLLLVGTINLVTDPANPGPWIFGMVMMAVVVLSGVLMLRSTQSRDNSQRTPDQDEGN